MDYRHARIKFGFWDEFPTRDGSVISCKSEGSEVGRPFLETRRLVRYSILFQYDLLQFHPELAWKLVSNSQKPRNPWRTCKFPIDSLSLQLVPQLRIFCRTLIKIHRRIAAERRAGIPPIISPYPLRELSGRLIFFASEIPTTDSAGLCVCASCRRYCRRGGRFEGCEASAP